MNFVPAQNSQLPHDRYQYSSRICLSLIFGFVFFPLGRSERGFVVSQRKTIILVLAAVGLVSLLTLSPCWTNSFVDLDDPQYVLNNSLLASLSFDSLWRMFVSFVMGNYHPLTTLSLAVDHHFFGLTPGGYHAHNIILHLVNVALVFWLVMRLGGRPVVAGVSALLFAIHPLHMESVAWITERKDLLYAFFYLAGMICYTHFLQTGQRRFWWGTGGFFVLSLLAKIQAVTFPITLLLLDLFFVRRMTRTVWLEKLPLLVLSVLFGLVGLFAAQTVEALHYTAVFSWGERIVLAGYSLGLYLARLVFPMGLSCLYPYPEKVSGFFSLNVYAVSLLAWLAAVASLYLSRRNKWLTLGTAFFAVNIAPGLQIVPVGHAFSADRFTYLAAAGLFMLAGGWVDAQYQHPRRRGYVTLLLPIYIILLATTAWNRCAVWQDPHTLWSDAITKYPDFHEPYLFRGNYFRGQGLVQEALTDYHRSVALQPDFVKGLVNRGSLYQDLGWFSPALADYNQALRLRPDRPEIYGNRANVYSQLKEYDLAAADYQFWLTMDPYNSEVYYNRALMYYQKGDWNLALVDLSRSIELNRRFAWSFYTRALVHEKLQDYPQALADFVAARERGLNINPSEIERVRSLIKE